MSGSTGGAAANPIQKDRVMMKREKLEGMLEQFRESLELFINSGTVEDGDAIVAGSVDVATRSSSSFSKDCEADKFCSLLKSRVGCLDFLEKLESAQASIPQSMTEEGSSWDIVNENDIWGSGGIESDEDDYVLVRQEDIVDGIACFMAAYLMSLEQTKDLTPNLIQEALGKTFSVKKRKGRLQKAWEGSKVIYNVASWGAYSHWIISESRNYHCCLSCILEFLPCDIKAFMSTKRFKNFDVCTIAFATWFTARIYSVHVVA